MNRELIDKLVDRFLSWPLPKTFAPDCGISFDGRKPDQWNKNRGWPVGTNLFTAEEARAMFEHALTDWLAACADAQPVAAPPLQSRVQPWMLECFGPKIAADVQERCHRFIEESLELVQSLGCTASEAHQLVDYVYGRAAGDAHQEVGGAMITLAALCLARGLDMDAAGESELARIWTKVDVIRAKQAAKPKHSPLPAQVAAAPPARKSLLDVATERERQVTQEGWTAEHDAAHVMGILGVAGACYALHAAADCEPWPKWKAEFERAAVRLWPFDEEWWKPKDVRHDLVRAAALIVAEIDRLDAAAAKDAT